MSLSSVYYFCITEYADDSRDDPCLSVVKLGSLPNDEPDMVFDEAVRPLIEVIRKIPENKCEFTKRERSLNVMKGNFSKFGSKILRTDYELQIEEFAPTATLLRWNMMSDTFLQSRYQASLRQLGQSGFSKPTNDTVLATAYRAAEWFQQNVEYVGSLLPAESIYPAPIDLGSAEGAVDEDDVDPPIKKSEKHPLSSKKAWIFEQAFTSDESLHNDKKKPAEIRDLWNKLKDHERKEIDPKEWQKYDTTKEGERKAREAIKQAIRREKNRRKEEKQCQIDKQS